MTTPDLLIRAVPQQDFGPKFRDFRKKYRISIIDIAALCKGAPFTSKSSLNRIEVNKRTGEKPYIEAIVALEFYLTEWALNRNLDAAEIDADLNELFPFRMDNSMDIINRCELTATAIKFFALKADPFDVDRVPGEEEIFTNKELDEVAARVSDAVLYKRFVAVIGAVGTGKTSMKIRMEREMKDSKTRTHLIYPEFFDMNAINVSSIARYILEEFEITVPRDSTAKMRKIKQLLTSLEKDDARIALIFDECHRLNEKVLIALKNFWEMTNGGYSRLLGIVLFGQPKFVETTLRDTQFREIAERVQIIEMPAITKTAENYLAHKLASVGGDIHKLFDPKAVKRICAAAKTPLSLGNLANSALMEAFKIEEPQVASGMLKLQDEPKLRTIRNAA